MDYCHKTYNYSICRVCLAQITIDAAVSLEEKTSRTSQNTLGQILITLAGIPINNDDSLPTKICQNCKKMVRRIHYFKVMCQNNNKKLQNIANLSRNDPRKCMEMICEYKIFCQYFPGKIFENNNNSSIKNNVESESVFSPVQTIFNPTITNYCDYECYSPNFLFNNDQNYYNDSKNIDLFLGSIEKVVDNQKINEVKIQRNPITNQNLDLCLGLKRVKTKLRNQKKVKKHQQVKSYHCDICDRTLASRFSYKNHMQRHTNFQLICDQCGKGFYSKVSLSRHLIKNHDTGPFLQCDHCTFKCSGRFDLVEHIRIHTGERPITCDKCGLTFRRKAIWTNHLKQHRDKEISCKVCQKKFYRQSELNAHTNSMHERMFLYLCNVCNTSFAKGGTVRKHLLTKHGVPRDKQGKITRVTKNSNSLLFIENKGRLLMNK